MPQSKDTKRNCTAPSLAPRGDLVEGTVVVMRPGVRGAVVTSMVFIDIPVGEDLNAAEEAFLQELVTAIPDLRTDRAARDRFLHLGKGICRPDGVFWARHVAAGRWILSRVSDAKTGSA